MPHHTEARHGRILRGLNSRRVRAVLCLGIFAAPAAVGTMAYWTDEATIESGDFTSGTLDLTVGPTLEDSSRLPGTGGTTSYSALNIANLVPGESLARPFVVRNSGTTGFTYNGTISTIDDDLVAPGSGLMVGIYLNSTPDNTGTEEAGNRAGFCSGDLLLEQAVSTSTNTVDVSPTDLTLIPSDTDVYCVRVLLQKNSPNTLQGKITELVVQLDAEQVTVP